MAIGGRHRTHGAAPRSRYSLPTYESPRPPHCLLTTWVCCDPFLV
nr:MAG TPA: hypothetical protein [Caudoviricetes sp.]